MPSILRRLKSSQELVVTSEPSLGLTSLLPKPHTTVGKSGFPERISTLETEIFR